MEAAHPPQLRRFPSVLGLGKLVAVVAKETAAAKELRKLREERAGVPPAGGKKR